MRVLVFGARGFIGSRLLAAIPSSFRSTSDIAERLSVRQELEQVTPDVVINCAGKTGRPNIDWCEDHKRETLRSNVTGTSVLLEECLRRDILLVHIGSACVFDGNNNGKGFGEEDPPNFSGSYYSRTKAMADQLLTDFPVLILRLRMPFDDTRHPRSMINRLKTYPRALDVQNSMTYLPDFIDAATMLIKKRATGIYHIVNPGTTSPYEIMLRYKALVDPSHVFERLSLAQLSSITRAPRSNCMIATPRLDAAGFRMRPIHDAVEVALRSLARR
jgi:3,5-epimerase/4-reductase